MMYPHPQLKMFKSTGRIVLALLVLVAAAPGQVKRDFTVADDIGVATFGGVPGTLQTPFDISPDGALIWVETTRGLLDQNRPQDELRFYRLDDVRGFLNQSDQHQFPEPVWTFQESTNIQAPNITGIRWLADSSGVAFLLTAEGGRNQLWLAEIKRKRLTALTPADLDVTSFDVRDRTHFVFTVRDPAAWLDADSN